MLAGALPRRNFIAQKLGKIVHEARTLQRNSPPNTIAISQISLDRLSKPALWLLARTIEERWKG